MNKSRKRIIKELEQTDKRIIKEIAQEMKLTTGEVRRLIHGRKNGKEKWELPE